MNILEIPLQHCTVQIVVSLYSTLKFIKRSEHVCDIKCVKEFFDAFRTVTYVTVTAIRFFAIRFEEFIDVRSLCSTVFFVMCFEEFIDVRTLWSTKIYELGDPSTLQNNTIHDSTDYTVQYIELNQIQ